MLPLLLLPLLPLLAGAEPLGGDHYVPHRKTGHEKVINARAPLGGDHYVPHRKTGHEKVIAKKRWFSPAAERERAFDSVLLDERGLPITATTTVVVPMTTWVTVTAEAPTPSANASSTDVLPTASSSAVPTGEASSASSIVSSSSEPSSSNATPTGSADPTAVPTATPTAEPSSASASASGSASASASASASDLTPSLSNPIHIVLPPSSSGSATSSASGTPSETPSSVSAPSETPSSTPSEPSSTAAPTGSRSQWDNWWSASSTRTHWWDPSSAEPTPTLSSTASPSATESPSTSDSSSSSSRHHHSSADPTPTASASDEPSASASDEPSASASSSASASATSSYVPKPTSNIGERVMGGYYADWAASQMPPESVDWSRFDVIDFAFAEPTTDGRLLFTQDNSEDLLHRLVAGAHAAGKRVKLSIGGWTGSKHFSTLCKTASARSSFIKNIVGAINTFQLDGVDLDWEYPGAKGAGGNAVSPDDTENFLVFVQQLRAAVPEGSLITAATQVWPFYGPDGNPVSDVSGFAEVFDWILLMNYDIWGSSSKPGPNAPLSNGCKDSEQPTANAYSAVASWTAAGMPANKITLGVPAYGYIQMSSADKLYGRRSYPPARRAVTIENGEGGTSDGQVGFASLVQQGALTGSGATFKASSGFTRNWDECSSTPWLKSDASGQIITYDDPQSMNLKGQFAAQAGLRGCSVFSVDGDWVNGAWPLTDAVRSGMGI